ncbi:MAG: hypothetical protein JWO03_911 [Bacteroidetes bacterium]|nr:hypothetical protein [Bacteroidota bacterium]
MSTFIDQNEIYEKTDAGRLIIEKWYPDSVKQEAFKTPGKKFKVRSTEKTPSATVTFIKGVWLVKDWGGDTKARNAVQIVQLEENCDFTTALQIIARDFGIVAEGKPIVTVSADIKQRPAIPEEIDGVWEFETKDFTMAEVQTIIAPNVWEYLVRQVQKGKEPATEATNVTVLEEVVRIFGLYHFYSLKSYKVVKERKATEITSTADYPIFMFDELSPIGGVRKAWKKIYQPKNADAGKRFMHYGGRPNDFIFGYEQAHKAHEELIDIKDDDDPISDPDAKKHKDKKEKKKPKKLKQLIITAGGSDGLNMACLSQCFQKSKDAVKNAALIYPVWMNSETAKLSKGDYWNLSVMAETVYNLPDIDATGRREAHEMALAHLDIRTIWLPDELRANRDARNKPQKDLRDYFKHYTVSQFHELIKTAFPYRFWDQQPRYNKQDEYIGMGYVVNNKYLLNFLHRNGFYRYAVDMEDDTYFYIQIEHNVVTKVGAKKIRDYVNNFIEKRHPEIELMNTFLRTTQMNETALSSLPYASIDFNDFDRDSQWFFYNNRTVRVTAEGLTEFRPGDVDKYVWQEEVLKHRFTKLDDYFTITKDDVTGEYDIVIHNQDCLVLRYLINASRIFWREELEERLDGIDEDKREQYAIAHNFTADERKLMDGIHRDQQAVYRLENKFNIAGPLLTKAEQTEQKQHLINKLFQLGFKFHRHKSPSRAWATWTMDAKLTDGNESHGGSGKSLLPNLIYSYSLMKTKYIGASDPKVLDNKHVKEGITEHTDLLFVDDCSRYFNFRFFFADITTATEVNPKNSKAVTIPFEKSPKPWFTSNYPPHDIDASKQRRILYTLYSDYYHENANNEYRETRSPFDDFGKNLGRDFDEIEWNLFLNLITQCVKFFMNTDDKINPPMDNINKRNQKALMGDAFQGWADVYFSDLDRINTEPGEDKFVIREEAMEDFKKSSGQSGWSTNKFSAALKAWCRYYDYELDPSDVKGWRAHDSGRGGRITRKVKIKDKLGNETSQTKEVIYIRMLKKEDDEILPF